MILLTYPFQHHVYFFYAAEMVNSFFGAIIDVAVVAWMLDLWQERANTFLLIMCAVGAVGGTVSPFLVTPFLSVREAIIPSNMTNSTAVVLIDPVVHVVKESRIVIPYSVTAAVHMMAAVTLLVLFFKSPYKHQQKVKLSAVTSSCNDVKGSTNGSDVSERQHQEEHNRSDASNSGEKYQTFTIIAGTMMYIFYMNTEVNAQNYLPKFLLKVDPSISKQTAALMGSTFSAAFALAFGITVFASTKVRVIHMLYAYFLLIICGNVLLALFAPTPGIITWTAIVILGVGHSSMSSGIYSFLEQRIGMSDRVVGIMISVYALTMILNTLTIGQYVESFPLSYVYVNLFCIFVSFIVLVGLTLSDLCATSRL